jgi:hypothetical protein
MAEGEMPSRFQMRLPRPADEHYRLRRCTGYSVYSRDGRVGVVDEVVEVDGRPAFLTVRSGLFRSSAQTVDAAHVAEVVPGQMRVVVRPPA